MADLAVLDTMAWTADVTSTSLGRMCTLSAGAKWRDVTCLALLWIGAKALAPHTKHPMDKSLVANCIVCSRRSINFSNK